MTKRYYKYKYIVIRYKMLRDHLENVGMNINVEEINPMLDVIKSIFKVCFTLNDYDFS